MILRRRAMQRLPPLDRETELGLIDAARRGDEAARERLVLQVAVLVWQAAIYWDRRRALPRGYEVEDLAQVGFVAVCRAVDLFDPARGFRWTTYASNSAQMTIQREVVRTLQKQDRLDQSLADWRPPAAAADPLERVELRDEVERVERVIGEIARRDPRDAEVLRGRIAGIPLRALGERLGVTKERIRQLEKRARGELLERLQGRA